MIEVWLSREQLRVRGHAGFSRYGSDIICAAASMLAFTLAQAAQELAPGAEVHSACGEFRLRLAPRAAASGQAAAMMQTIGAGYRLLEERYPDHVRVMSEERSEHKHARTRNKPETRAEGGTEG